MVCERKCHAGVVTIGYKIYKIEIMVDVALRGKIQGTYGGKLCAPVDFRVITAWIVSSVAG
jgi:hypothetical protein